MINHPIITKNQSPGIVPQSPPTTKISKGDVFSLRSIHVPANLGAILEKSILPRNNMPIHPWKNNKFKKE